MAASASRASASEATVSRVEELSDLEASDVFALPPWLMSSYLDLPHDKLKTKTTEAQQKTEAECLPLLQMTEGQLNALNSAGLPRLMRKEHITFLHKSLGPYPAPYAAMDASRPWYFYWVLQGLTALGQDVTEYKERLITTLRPLQNPSGGFAGGHGQYSHSAPTYACVLALAMVGGLEAVDRTTMWHFLGNMKQSDGGFRVADMAEEDIRGAYCAMTVVALLDLPLDLPPDAPSRKAGLTSFLDGLGEWIGRCQTYEGGIAGAPGFEAHGAYAFCALACLSIIDAPHRSIPQYLDVPALTRWMTAIQTTPEGGFAGRTNKLVDACYSHWVGGSWAMLDAATKIQASRWSRAGLARYLHTCCQQEKKGGLRDKPSTRPDPYHTCYSLAGLSAAEHRYTYLEHPAKEQGVPCLTAPFGWGWQDLARDEQHDIGVDKADVVEPVHPVFVIPFSAVDKVWQKLSQPKAGEL